MNFPLPNGDFCLWLTAIAAMLIAIDYEIVYNGIRGGYFEYLELVEVDGSCLA